MPTVDYIVIVVYDVIMQLKYLRVRTYVQQKDALPLGISPKYGESALSRACD